MAKSRKIVHVTDDEEAQEALRQFRVYLVKTPNALAKVMNLTGLSPTSIMRASRTPEKCTLLVYNSLRQAVALPSYVPGRKLPPEKKQIAIPYAEGESAIDRMWTPVRQGEEEEAQQKAEAEAEVEAEAEQGKKDYRKVELLLRQIQGSMSTCLKLVGQFVEELDGVAAKGEEVKE